MSIRTSHRTRSARIGRTTSLGLVAALAAWGLTACTVTSGEESSQSPTTATTSAAEGTSPSGSPSEPSTSPTAGSESPSASASPSESSTGSGQAAGVMSLDQLAEALLDKESFPVADSVTREDTRVESAPFTMYVNLNGFTPEGECAAALEKVNSFEAPQSTVVATTYETDLEPADGGDTPPTVQFMAVATQSPLDVMAVYSEIAQACGTLEGDQATGATAVFEPFELGGDGAALDVDALQLQIDSGSGQAQTMVIGGISEGRNHLYTVMSLVDPEDARQILTAQAQRFRAALEQDS